MHVILDIKVFHKQVRANEISPQFFFIKFSVQNDHNATYTDSKNLLDSEKDKFNSICPNLSVENLTQT